MIPTPFWTYVHYHGEKWKEYGDEKMNWMFAHKSFLDYGIRVPGASDYGPGPFEPLMALQSMVTRKDFSGNVWGPNQRVTLDEALTIATINGAYASHEESVKGSITRRQVRRLRDARQGSARGESRRDQEHPGGAHRGRRQDRVSEGRSLVSDRKYRQQGYQDVKRDRPAGHSPLRPSSRSASPALRPAPGASPPKARRTRA